MIRLITTLAMLLHWFTCVWAFVALQGVPGVSLDGLDTWVKVTLGDDPELGSIYMVGLYVSVVALFGGIGSVGPTNMCEYAVLTCILFSGCFFWAYVISSLCSMLATLNPHGAPRTSRIPPFSPHPGLAYRASAAISIAASPLRAHTLWLTRSDPHVLCAVTAFRQTMDELNHFMEENEFTQGHRVRIRRFFRATQDFVRRADSKRLLDKMSDRLKGDTALLIGITVLNKVWYFSLVRFDIEKAYLASVALALEVTIYEPKERFAIEHLTVITRGTCCVGLMIMNKGRVIGLDCLGFGRWVTRCDCLDFVRVWCLCGAGGVAGL